MQRNINGAEARLSIVREPGKSYSDLYNMVAATRQFYSKIEKVLGPYNAKQNGLNHYIPPSKQQLSEAIGRVNGMTTHDIIRNNMLSSAVKYCEKHKGKRQLVQSHHSTHHHVQIPESLFEIEQFDVAVYKDICKKDFTNIRSVSKITILGSDPFFVENLKKDQYKFLIVRQRMAKTGVASSNNWEALFFKYNPGYIIEWVDAEINPRWAGML